ncbi:ABC transporter permease [Futiania mangrovi]|uniref:ABC transporter permease n=1 Tax=Futiania mangrovi TaxID=2959716 RepID=A0A9J6PH55_9PROT|nr:ABC transporter permease [Futiania mangrovii]MCP1337152.1 ABC transporter permease [Futiania mangrovii]
MMGHVRIPRLSHFVAFFSMAFLLAPFVIVVGASFDTAEGFAIRFPPRELTLEWYLSLPQKYMDGFVVSLLVAILVAVCSAVLGLMIALALVRGRIIGRAFLESFFRIPVQIPLVVTGAVMMNFAYQVIAITGFNPLTNLTALVVGHSFVAIPYCVGAIGSVLARLDEGLEEAAASLGATQWETFWHVTLPALRPGLLAGMFYAFIFSFGDVPVSLFLVGPSTTTLPIQIFQDMQFDFQPGMLAISAIIVVFSFLAILTVQRVVGLDLVLPSRRK